MPHWLYWILNTPLNHDISLLIQGFLVGNLLWLVLEMYRQFKRDKK